MTEKIIEKLQKLGCDAWEITETGTRGWEFYFIRHRLDQNRAVHVRDIRVNVYRKLEGGAQIGEAGGGISPTASEEEIDRALAEFYDRASLVSNPAYKLNDAPIDIPEQLEKVDLAAISGDFIRAMREVKERADADVNSYEIFVKEIDRSYRNSNGVAYRCVYPRSQIEVVVNARNADKEIEIYRFFEGGTCNAEKLKADVQSAMDYGRDRLRAEPTPETAPMDVVFSTADALEIYDFFRNRMMADMKYRQFSDWEPGQPVSSEFAGDRLSLEVLPALPNSSRNYPVDEEGAVIRARYLIRDGFAEEYWGSRQYSQYLGLSESSLAHNIRISGGTKTAEEIRSGDFLEVVEFSVFQVDEVGCNFAGEIRLGYLHRGGEVKVVTGGSISGDMREAVKTMTFAKETVQYDTKEIPAATRLKNVNITGVKS